MFMTFYSRHPDDLYKNGIQRSSFIPTIELLKSQFEVTDLDSGTGKLTIPQCRYVSAYKFPQTTAEFLALCPMSTTILSRRKTIGKFQKYLNL